MWLAMTLLLLIVILLLLVVHSVVMVDYSFDVVDNFVMAVVDMVVDTDHYNLTGSLHLLAHLTDQVVACKTDYCHAAGDRGKDCRNNDHNNLEDT